MIILLIISLSTLLEIGFAQIQVLLITRVFRNSCKVLCRMHVVSLIPLVSCKVYVWVVRLCV